MSAMFLLKELKRTGPKKKVWSVLRSAAITARVSMPLGRYCCERFGGSGLEGFGGVGYPPFSNTTCVVCVRVCVSKLFFFLPHRNTRWAEDEESELSLEPGLPGGGRLR